MTFYHLDGIFSNEQVKRIKEKLEGKSYMNFIIEGGGHAGNNWVSVATKGDYTEQELKEMFIYCAMTSL
jgi:hypothetical protein